MVQESSILKQQIEFRRELMDKINELHSADNLNTILIPHQRQHRHTVQRRAHDNLCGRQQEKSFDFESKIRE